MDLVYVLDWPKNPKTGVPNKIRDQIEIWRRSNCKVSLVVIAPSKYKNDWLEFTDQVISYRSILGRIFSRFVCSIYLFCAKRSQVIYRRFGIFTFSELLTIIFKPTIIEVNTNNNEYYKTKSKFSFLIYKAQNMIVSLKAAGTCAVTPEIAKLQKYGSTDKTGIFTNSVSLENFLRKEPSRNKSEISFVFVASDNFEWNGLNRFQSIASQFPTYKFHLVGIDFHGSSNIHCHKPMFGQELRNFLRTMDFGISTLDLQKVGLSEAAPLKSRLYLSQGLPVIGSYLDPALQMQSKLYFEIKFNGPSNQITNFDALSNFIEYWKDREVEKLDLRNIDSNYVERNRVDFIRNKIHEFNNRGH